MQQAVVAGEVVASFTNITFVWLVLDLRGQKGHEINRRGRGMIHGICIHF